MAIQFGTVDGLVNISSDTILCFAKGIDEFVNQGGPDYANREGISYGTAFQRFIEPVYSDKSKPFSLASIKRPVLTRSGSEQSPARGTFCKKMGLLKMDESNDLFEITSLGKALLESEISIEEYAFILLSKMGIFKDGEYVGNLFNYISKYFHSHATISQALLEKDIKYTYNDSIIVKTRLDIIINSLVATGLLTKVTNDIYVLSGTGEAELLVDYNKHANQIKKAKIDTSKEYSEYIGNLDCGGIFDILAYDNIDIYSRYFPNLFKYMRSDKNYKSLQQIFYGAPGTGKSHKIKNDEKVKEANDKNLVFRTTFHPDSDYSTFVGAYKPTIKPVADKYKAVAGKDEEITYSFVPQAFLQAYVAAWNNPEENVYLVIEEINRGNCAQIFGDLFQLLDRDCVGFSEYPIMADNDLKKYLDGKDEEEKDILTNKDGIKDGKLRLPKNLYIWATMNTSDQSLFPIDSAFKRRWDWVYVPIDTAKETWYIKIEKNYYSWTEFLDKVNDELLTDETAEDKHLGFYFCKATDKKDGTESGPNVITTETFVGKVLFYLWNDVFKVYGIPSNIGSSKDWPYRKFYQTDGKVDMEKVAKLMEQLKIVPEGGSEIQAEEIEDQ